jgi:predicted nucleic acid-binding protein
MKVLVDTSVWSLALRRRKGAEGLSPREQRLHDGIAQAIQDGRVAMVGPVRQELLSGIGDLQQFERLRETLAAFPDEPLTTATYVEAARLDNLCRRNGVQCGVVDMLLCAAAIENGWTILTNDTALLRCIEVTEREPNLLAGRLRE